MLSAIDIFYTILHLAIIGFNLFGWIWKKTRKAHLVSVLITAGSWLILGIWYGLGYCPVTDWQWRVKRKLGETDLPGSFIKYFADKITGQDIDAGLINTWTAILFAAIVLIAILGNIPWKKMQPRS